MGFFTALIITYALHGQTIETMIVFDNFSQCEEALRVSGPLYEVIDRDHEETSMSCHKLPVVSVQQ